MPKSKTRTLPPRLINYLRVLVHRIKKGEEQLPLILYISPNFSRLSKIGKMKWSKVAEIDDIDFVDFDLLYAEIESKVRTGRIGEYDESVSG